MKQVSWGRRIAALLATAALLLSIRVGSLTPLQLTRVGDSVLRLSWTARPERIEQCRRLSDAELAQRPIHMQLRWQCEGHFARYFLSVTVDGEVLAADTVRGGGLRQDRPMHLFREYPLTPGVRRVIVTLHRIDTPIPAEDESSDVADGAAAADRETREAQERRVRRAEALPEVVTIDTSLNLPRGRVVLISYLPSEQRLAIVSDPETRLP